MPNLYIITGPAGVGKSTVSKELAKRCTKSALIEGDYIYSQVVGGYVSAWKEGNHLDVFWKICLDSINSYLEAGYDVIFNYIVTPKSFNEIKNRFKNYNVKFVVLIVDEETILKRDKQRPKDCQMNERCIVLLNNFKNYDFGKDYFLDSSNLSVDETINIIENDEKFNSKDFNNSINNSLFVYNLKDRPEFIEEVAILTQKEWGQQNLSINEFEFKVKNKINKIKENSNNPYYCKLILVKDSTLVGFISIFEHDCDERLDLSPWYATMYIKEAFRNKGYSKLLNDSILEEAKNRGFKKIYLKSELNNYYEKFGAIYLENLNDKEKIYYFDL